MKAGDVKGWVTLAVVAAGGYAVWKLWDKLATAGDAASKGIADAYVRATAGPVIQVLASVILPDGRKVPMSAIKITDSRNMLFAYGGRTYKLLRRRPDNDYDAGLAGWGARR